MYSLILVIAFLALAALATHRGHQTLNARLEYLKPQAEIRKMFHTLLGTFKRDPLSHGVDAWSAEILSRLGQVPIVYIGKLRSDQSVQDLSRFLATRYDIHLFYQGGAAYLTLRSPRLAAIHND